MRKVLLPALAHAADAQQVSVRALASHPTVANTYKAEMRDLIEGPTNRLGSIPRHRNSTTRASRT